MYDNDNNALATTEGGIPTANDSGGPVVSITTPTKSARTAVYANGCAKGRRDPAIERQVVACERYARSIGGQVVRVYVDHLMRGSDTHAPSAFAAILRGAEAGLFEMLVIEDPDRLSRDLSVLCALIRDINRHGVVGHVVAQGEITLANVTIRGLLTEKFHTLDHPQMVGCDTFSPRHERLV